MRTPITSRLVVASALAVGTGLGTLALSGAAGAASARALGHGYAAHALFVETDSSTGNSILSYHRASDGTVSFHASYATGGLGATAAGATADPLASQGGLLLADDGTRLVATNAGSDTLSVFAVDGASLTLVQTLASSGEFPASLTASGNFVTVLNSGGAGSIAEYEWAWGSLVPVPGQVRSLGLANTNPPYFTAGPGQVSYTPDGTHLIVAGKTSTSNEYLVYNVAGHGVISASSVPTTAQNDVPFAFTFDQWGQLVATEASNSSVSTYAVNANGTLSPLSTLADGQAALCWISTGQGYFFGSNAGSATVSSFSVSSSGAVTLVSQKAASTHAGTTDSVVSPDGRFLYVESGGAGALDAFAIGSTGALTPIETLWNIPVASEGLAVS